MSQQGYIRLHRRLLDNWIWPKDRPYSEAEAWIWLLFNAAHTPHKQVSDRQLVFVGVGELLYSTRALAKVWGWGRKRAANFLETLEKSATVRTTDCTRYDSRLKINHYADYQGKNEAFGTNDDTNDRANDDANGDTNEEPMPTLEPAQGEAKEPPINKGNKGKGKYIIPADFSVTDEMRAWAIKTVGNVDWLDEVTAEFVEYWQERGEKRPGWILTWKNRIKAVAEHKQQRGQMPTVSTAQAQDYSDPNGRGCK